MSILIKGMEMPASCSDCGQFRWDNYLQNDVCRIAEAIGDDGIFQSENEGIDKRPSWCPIIELPPHGRLIDADEMVASVKRQTEIMREIAKEVDKLKPIANSKELDDVDIVAIAETVEKGVLQEIANAPTIVEAEEGE